LDWETAEDRWLSAMPGPKKSKVRPESFDDGFYGLPAPPLMV
jgi:hypothetical protein